MQLKIQYYALMREQAGRSEETLETQAATPADLYCGIAGAPWLHPVARTTESGRQQRIRRLVASTGRPAMPWCSYRRWRAADALSFRTSAIDTAAARRELLDPGAGGYVSFEGWVRDHNEGQEVTRLEYEAFEELAVKEGERILAEAQHRFPHQARVVHPSRGLAGLGRHGGMGGREFGAPRRSLRCLSLHHR